MTNTFSLIESDRETQVFFVICDVCELKMLLLPSVYSFSEHYEIKTPFKRKVTERGFLGLVYFNMEQFVRMHCAVLIQLTKAERPWTWHHWQSPFWSIFEWNRNSRLKVHKLSVSTLNLSLSLSVSEFNHKACAIRLWILLNCLMFLVISLWIVNRSTF